MIPRRGDMIPVQVQAADGPVIAWFTPEEYATHWQGMDQEAVEALEHETVSDADVQPRSKE